MLSGDPIASMAMGDGHDHGEHEQHAHPAAMALISADQATNTVVASGDWSDPAVWQNGTLPTDGARIVIPEGMTLTVDSVISQEFKTIGIHGTLSFATDVDTELRVDTIISAPHGRFEIGTAENPIAANVTAIVVFADDGVIDTNWDPEQLSRGAVLQGPTEIHGAATTHQVTLAAHPAAGAATLQLSSVPAGWNVGDEIVVTGTQGSTSDEVRTIAALDGSTVTLNQALELDHSAPRADLNVYVANTTRNVELTSENAATAHRGHVMFMHTNNVSVKNAAFTQLGRTDKKIPLDDFNFEFPEDAVGNRTTAGVVFTATPGARTNVRGRYPVHFHRGGTDPTSTPGVVDGSVVVGSPGYGLVNHSAHVHLTNNVSYDVHGSAFYTEAGDEIGTIVNNIAIRTVNPDFRLEDNGEISVDLRADQQDFGVDGDAFWLSGHLVSMRDNIASGASGHGIIIWSDGLVESDRGRSTVKTSDIENGHLITGRDTIPTWWAPLAEITNNESSNATIGFRTRYIHSSIYLGDVGSPFHEPPDQAYIDTLSPTVDGLTVWGSRDGALLNYSERLSLKNADIIGIGAPYVRQDDTTDLGVGIDMYNENSRGPGSVENVAVQGFNMGILAPRHGEWQMSNVHLRNTTDLHIEQATIESRTLDMTNVTFGDLAGTAVAGNEGQRRNVEMKGDDAGIQPFWFLMTDTVSLNGQGLYFHEQSAGHVPLTVDLREESRAPVPTEFVGQTNQQLQDTYGTSFGGEITPSDAQTVSWLTGGVVGGLAEPGQTDPPLYEMRDADTFDVVSLGTLTNFDPSQLQTGVPDDEGETDEAGGDDGDDESDEDPGDDEEDDDAGDETEEDDEDSDDEPGDEEEESDEDEGDEDSDEEPGDEESDEGDEESSDEGSGGDVFAATATLVGTSESEKLQGFESDDIITGNGGPDLFPFTAGNDVITDFDPAEDMIDVGDFARETDDFAVLTSLAAIAANSTQTTIDGETALVIDVDGDMGDSTTTLIGIAIDDLNLSNVFFGLDGESIPPLVFTHIPETTVTLNEGTVASFPAHDLSVHPLPFALVSGSQESVDALNGLGGDDEEAEPDDDEIDDDGLDPEEDPGEDETGDHNGQDLESLLGQLRSLTTEEVDSLLASLDVEDEQERQEISDLVNELRTLSDEELTEAVAEASEEERGEVTELLSALLGGGADDEGDEETGEDETGSDGDHDHGEGDTDTDGDHGDDGHTDDDHGDDGQGDTGGDGGHGDGDHDHGDNSCDAHAGNPTFQQEHCAAMALATPEGATHSAVASGDWSDPNVWQNGTVPTDGAAAYIPAGVTVTIDGVVTETIQTLRVDGTLRFNPSVNTELRVDTVIAAPGSRFEMGTADNPIADGVSARLVVADTGAVDRANDPFFLGRGLVLHGTSVIHGAAKTSFATTAIAPRAGDTTLTLAEIPTNWDVGDTLVIAGTRTDAEGDEVVTIASISGATITLEDTLEFDHIPPRSEFAVHIANTTRNAVIESENAALDRRGHLMFMHSRDVQIAYGGFYELGRTNKLEELNGAELDANGRLIENTGTNPAGRYSVHFHRNGVRADSAPATVHGSAVVGSPGWGYVNHSSYVDFTDNVSYNVNGAAFNTEAGNEIGSFSRNLSIRTHGTGESPVERQGLQDFGHAGDGFWFQGAGIRIEDNVATGATGAGLIVYSDALIQGGLGRTEFLTENLADPSLAGGLETIPATLVPLRSFRGNTAYGSVVGARTYYHRTLIQVDEDQFDQAAQLRGAFPDSVMEDMLIWNSNEGYLANYTVDTIFRNFTIVNAADQPGESGYNATNVYNRGIHTYENFDIEGFATGLVPSRNGNIQIIGGRFRNGHDIEIQEPRQTHRRLTIDGTIDFVDGAGLQLEDEFIPRQNIVMFADPRSIPDSTEEWYLLNDRVILNHNDHNGEQLFYAEQAADHVLYTGQPAQAVPDDPAPGVNGDHIGLTNAQLQQMFGSSFGGVLPSSDAVDVSNDGIVGLLGTVTPDPGPLPEVDDPLTINPADRAELVDGIRDLQEVPQATIDQLLAALNPDDVDVEATRAIIEELRSLEDSAIDAHVEGLSVSGFFTTVRAIDDLFETGEEPDDEETSDEEDPGEDDNDTGDDEESGENDEETDDDEEPGEDDEDSGGDEEPGEDGEDTGDDEEPGEDDEDTGDDEETGEDDEDTGDNEETGEDDEDSDDPADDEEEPGLPELETPQGPLTVTLAASEDGFELVLAGTEMLVLDGDMAIRHIDLTQVTSLTIDGTEMSDQIVLDLEEADALGLESITVNGGGGNDTVHVDGYRSDIATELTINADAGNDIVLAGSSTAAVIIHGGDGNDLLEGGQAGDVITGGNGNDVLQGRGGHDDLHGGDGNDRLNGHGGHDTMSGGAGRDRLIGHSGRDVMRGDDGNDVLRGGGGHDVLIGGQGRDRLMGQGGHDTMVGGAGHDMMKGGAGDDAISGGLGNDRAVGGPGDDILVMGAGDDDAMGGGGRDIMIAGAGNDRIAGQAARDTVVTGEGDDEVTGPTSEIDEDFELLADWVDLV